MTSTTETETKSVEPQAANKDETLPVANENVEAVKDGDKDADKSAPGSPTKKTGTLKSAITVHKKDFEKDMVYLYQIVRTPTIPSLSAGCLKAETWLRVVGVKYENVDHKLRYKSKKGNLPFVELNGKEIEDTDVIIQELANYFQKDIDDGLTPDQKTVSHAFTSMLENHTGWIVRCWRYNNPQEFLDTAQLDIKRTFNSRFPNAILNFVFKLGIRKHLKDAVVSYPMGQFEQESELGAAKADLLALSHLLGTQDYFFGKTPRLLDCVVFAHLAQYIYVPFAGFKEWIETETPNLFALVERMKTAYWSDWDEILPSFEANTHAAAKPEDKPESADGQAAAATGAEDPKKLAEEKKAAEKAEKKRLAEEKKKEREEKKKKEKEEKERKKKEKEEADKAAKEKAAAEEAAKQAEAKAKAAAEQANKTDNAAPAAAAADGAVENKEQDKPKENAPNGADAAKSEVTASE